MLTNKATSEVDNTYSTEKAFYINMAHGADKIANEKVDILFPVNKAFWGSLIIEVTGNYNYQNSSGKYTKEYGLGLQYNGSIYTQETQVTSNLGPITDNVYLTPVKWDSTNNRYYITFVHRVDTSNYWVIKIKATSNQADFIQNINNATLGPYYTTNTTTYPPDQWNVNENALIVDKSKKYVGISTKTPNALLQIGDISRNDKADLLFRTPAANMRLGSSSTGNDFWIRDDNSANAYRFYINSTGNLGIGTTAPQARIHINGTGQNGLFIQEPYPTMKLISTKANGRVWCVYNGSDVNNNFRVYDQTSAIDRFNIDTSGNVGIGTTTPTCKLDVKGNIRAEEIKVEVVDATDIKIKNDAWADYVFKDNYILKPLSEVESFIKENNHLPEVPSAKDIQKNGLDMSEMMATQMKKIEELTLHLIEQDKEITDLKLKFAQLEKPKSMANGN